MKVDSEGKAVHVLNFSIRQRNSGQLHALATLSCGKNTSTNQVGSWVDLKPSLDAVKERKIPDLGEYQTLLSSL
jgi:hypothetical protein